MFNTLTLLPSDPIYGMQSVYNTDLRPYKINLSIGICLDEEGNLLRFKAVHEAEKKVFHKHASKGYLPITGLNSFCEKAQKLILGKENSTDFFSAQTVGGTGALFIAGQLLIKAKVSTIYIPDPTWPNHNQLFQAAGLNVKHYPYYNKASLSLEFDKMVQAISQMDASSAIVLQASCHNPTGIDPTKEQWQTLSSLLKEKQILPIFDLAYAGLGEGIQEDTQAIQLFAHDDHDMFICTTFSKSLGLYNDRLGLISIKLPHPSLDIISSHLRSIARTCYSSPPAAGALLACEIFNDDSLQEQWLSELTDTCHRLQSQRSILVDALKKHNCKIPYSHITQTKGLFCLLDIPPAQVLTLQKEHGIYIAMDGRISLAAITKENVETIAAGISAL